MFRHIHDRTALWPLLSGLVLLGMWSDATAWVLCPHMSGSSHRCFREESATHSHKSVIDTRMEHPHCTDMQMSDMDKQNMPIDMSNMDMEDATTSEVETRGLIDIKLINPAPIERVIAAITQSTGPCSHCMMHSRSDANLPSRAVVLSSSLYESLAADSSVALVPALPSSITLVEIHDHSPPGSSGPRYVLNSTFRI